MNAPQPPGQLARVVADQAELARRLARDTRGGFFAPDTRASRATQRARQLIHHDGGVAHQHMLCGKRP